MIEFKSKPVHVNGSPEIVFARLSNPESLGRLFASMREKAEQSGMEMPAEMAQNLDKISLSGNSITIKAGPTGALTLIRSRMEEPAKVTYEGENTPVPIAISFIIEPADALASLQISLEAEIPAIAKMMVAKPMQQAVDMMATLMEKIPTWE